ncbi:glycerophosphoryl diester phosphodiesterase [Algoriphagus alkaliphilus]|uniref:Glycerophosphoryl diester phosphodiesterase n=1 Tax=Algoriphagus alkaliphilus TaxID=279824 RepID=A0A1G5Z2F8_9BACT|nr:glycerophosphodiester phosphodiesterase family protein [Algoriphagus alkaliphilus]MBA4300823.1 glycerophosphodiester phosphodiesterase [Cyclobacterium sp.]SDA88700.1 glycerophosphoryl diester phosphodiesterase [Algoriphagus alkaliphilus]
MIRIQLTCLAFLLISFSSCSQDMFHQNKVIAHRGAWKAQGFPQNSLASLNEAIRLGCEGSEFDVWMTADEVLVVNHDPEFMGLDIEHVSYEQLLAQKLPNGESIPTLKEYLAEGMKQTGTKLILEFKPSRISKERSERVGEMSVKTVMEMGAEKWVDYITFSYEGGKKAIATDPKANVAYLNGDKSPAQLKEDGFFGFDYNIRVLRAKPEWIKEAQDLGLTVNAWTVNNPEDMLWLLEQKADFITTDEPELLFELIRKK